MNTNKYCLVDFIDMMYLFWVKIFQIKFDSIYSNMTGECCYFFMTVSWYNPP